MSFPRDPQPPPQLTTTHIGGGVRAWLVALGALVVLGSVIYLGLSGHSAVPGPSQRPAPSALVAAVASPTPSPSATGPLTEVESIRADPAAPVLYQYLGTGLLLSGRETLAILDEVAPDLYRGMYKIPYSLVTPTADLEFAAVAASVSHDDLEDIGEWTLPLNLLRPGSPAATVFDMFEPAGQDHLSNPDFNRLATNGYHLTITTEGQADAGLLTIDVEVNPDHVVPDVSYGIVAGPSRARFSAELGQESPISWAGGAAVPRGLEGQLIPITLTAVPATDPSAEPADVGTWWIRVPAKPKPELLASVDAPQVGRPIYAGEPQILSYGFDIRIGETFDRSGTYLTIALIVNPIA